MGFSRQEYWSGLPCPPARGLPDPGIEPVSLTSPPLAGGLLTTSTTCADRQGFHQLYLHGASQSHTEKGIFFFFPQDFAATEINYPGTKTGNPPGLFMGLNTALI